MDNENEFVPPVLEAAIALHEMFITFRQAGFTEYQAIIMVVELLKNSSTEDK